MPPRSLPTAGGSPSAAAPRRGAGHGVCVGHRLGGRRPVQGGRRGGDRHRRRRGQGPGARPPGSPERPVEALWLGTHLAIYPLGLVGPAPATSPRGTGSSISARCSAVWSSPTSRRPGRRSCCCTAWPTTGRSSPCCGSGCAAAGSARYDDELLDPHRGRPRGRRAAGRGGRGARRRDRVRAGPRGRAQHGRAHRPLLRDPARRGRAGPHAGDPGQPPPRDLPGVRVEQPDHAAAASRGAR